MYRERERDVFTPVITTYVCICVYLYTITVQTAVVRDFKDSVFAKK